MIQSQGGVVVDGQDQLLLVLLLLLTTLLIHHALAHARPGCKEFSGKYTQDRPGLSRGIGKHKESETEGEDEKMAFFMTSS